MSRYEFYGLATLGERGEVVLSSRARACGPPGEPLVVAAARTDADLLPMALMLFEGDALQAFLTAFVAQLPRRERNPGCFERLRRELE